VVWIGASGNGFFTGARPQAIVPALGFLPGFVWLIFSPTVAHATAWAGLLFPWMAVAEFVGVAKMVHGCAERPFHLLTMLSLGAMLVLLVIAS